MGATEHYVSLAMYSVGFVGNIFLSLVWARHTRKIGGARFLMVLSVVDLLTIICLAAWSVLALGNGPCKALLMMSAGDAFYTLSCFYTIAIVIQKYACIAFPFSVNRFCSTVHQRAVIWSLPVLTALQQSLDFVFSGMRYKLCIGVVEPVGPYSPDEFEKLTLAVIYTYLALNLVPLVLLLVFNVLLIKALWSIRRLPIPEANRQHDRAKQKVAGMVVCASSTTLLTYITLQLTNLYIVFNWEQSIKPNSFHFYFLRILVFMREVSVAFSVSVNVFFYSCFSDTFHSAISHRWRRLTGHVRARVEEGNNSSQKFSTQLCSGQCEVTKIDRNIMCDPLYVPVKATLSEIRVCD